MIEQLLFYIAVVITIDLAITMFYTIKDLSKGDILHALKGGDSYGTTR